MKKIVDCYRNEENTVIFVMEDGEHYQPPVWFLEQQKPQIGDFVGYLDGMLIAGKQKEEPVEQLVETAPEVVDEIAEHASEILNPIDPAI